MGLIDIVVRILAKYYDLDCVEGRMAGPVCGKTKRNMSIPLYNRT